MTQRAVHVRPAMCPQPGKDPCGSIAPDRLITRPRPSLFSSCSGPQGTVQMIMIRWPARAHPVRPGRTKMSQAKSCESSPGLTSRQSSSAELADSESTWRVPSKSRSDRLAFHTRASGSASRPVTSDAFRRRCQPVGRRPGRDLIRQVDRHLSLCRLDRRGEGVDVVGAVLAAAVDEERGGARHSAGAGRVDVFGHPGGADMAA
jgi:hypothetical protein